MLELGYLSYYVFALMVQGLTFSGIGAVVFDFHWDWLAWLGHVRASVGFSGLGWCHCAYKDMYQPKTLPQTQ